MLLVGVGCAATSWSDGIDLGTREHRLELLRSGEHEVVVPSFRRVPGQRRSRNLFGILDRSASVQAGVCERCLADKKMADKQESEVAPEVSPEDGMVRSLPSIKTKRETSVNPEPLELPIPSITCLEQDWEDEPMTPAGRVFTEMNPLFVGVCVFGFKYPVDRRKFKAHLEQTLLKHKRFCSRVETRKGRPWWTQVSTNVEDHVFEAHLTPEQKKDSDCVMNYTADVILPRPFDTSKPLWDVHLLDAKIGEEAESCCVFRIHHALGDGTSLIALLMACTRTVDKPDVLPTASASAGEESKTVPKQTRKTSFISRKIAVLRRFLLVCWCSLIEIGKASATIFCLKDSSTLLTPYSGLEFTPVKWRFATIRMDDIKSVSKEMGVTINDVFIAIGAYGLRRYLEYRAVTELGSEETSSQKPKSVNRSESSVTNEVTSNEITGEDVSKVPASVVKDKAKILDKLKKKLDNLRVRAAVLINTRPSPGLQELSEMMNGKASQARWGNHMGYLIMKLPMNVNSKPLELVRQAHAIGNSKKLSLEGIFSYASGAMVMRMFGQKVAKALVTKITLQTTLSMSNVKGPTERVMFAGNPITHIVPSAIGHPHGLVLHLQSYNGDLSLGAMASKTLIPDPEYLLALCMDGLQEIISQVAAQKAKNR